MKQILFTIFLTLLTTFVKADERTDVIILGNNASAIAAGIQSARSGVKTIWINTAASLDATFSIQDTVAGNQAGIWPEFLKRLKEKPVGSSAELVKNFTDTVKNLSVINSGIRKIESAGKGWEVKLANGREIKCQVLVDGGNHRQLFEKAPAALAQRLVAGIIPADLYSSRLFRTAIAIGNNPADLLPMGSLLSQQENYLLAPNGSTVGASMLAGQAAGAAAAYCAYFKTTSRQLNVRMTQGELLRYNAVLIPTTDVQKTDTNFIAIQHVLATGILKLKNGNFSPQATISSEELRLPLQEYYSRSQLWFFNNKRDSLTIEDAINLIMFTATRGEELRREIEKGWTSSLKLNTLYAPKRAISRRELAVLVDRFLQPFNVRVDFTGRLLR